MAKSASRYVYEVSVDYTGDLGLKRLQEDLNKLSRIDAFRSASEDLKKLRAEAARAKTDLQQLETAFDAGGGQVADLAALNEARRKYDDLERAVQRQTAARRRAAEELKNESVAVRETAKLYAELQKSAQTRARAAGARSVLGTRSDAAIRAEIDGVKRAYRELAASGTASTAELQRAAESLRTKLGNLRGQLSGMSASDRARNLLGLPKHSEIQAEIEKVRRAYQTLMRDGSLTGHERSQAHVAMLRQTAELRAQTNGWTEALGRAKGQLLALAGAFAGVGKGVKLSIEFETNMADVRKTVGGTKAEIESLGRDLRGMALRIPIDPNDLARIAAIGGQLGMARDEIEQFTDITAKMGAAFDMSAEEAGNAIGKMKNVFQLDLTGVEAMGDAVNQLGNNMAARERDIIDVMLRIGGTSKQFGIADENAAALAASMLALGRPAEVAGTAINAMMNKLQTAKVQPKRFQEALAALGMSAEDMAAKIQASPQKALEELLETLAKLEGAQRAEILTGLFGAEFQDDVGVLVGSLDTYRKALDLVADRTKYAGAMQEEFGNRTDTTEAKLQLLANAARDIWQTIGEGFKIALAGVAEYVTPVLSAIADMIREFPKMSAGIVFFTGMQAAARPLIYIGSNLALAFRAIGAAVSGIGAASTLAGLKLFTTHLNAANFAAAGLKGAIVALGRVAGNVFAAGSAGWAVGEWLNKFDVVRQAGVALAAGLEKAFLRVKLGLATITGGDTAAIRRELEQVDRVYGEMFADIERGVDEYRQKQKKAAGEQKRDQQGVADNAAQVNDQMVNDAEITAKELSQAYKAHAEEVRRLQEQISGRQKSLQAELRDMARGGMNDADAWVDQRNAAQEYMRAAKQAADEARRAQAGEDTITAAAKWKEAVQYADDAKAAYKALNHEVKSGDQVIISAQTALKGAMKGVKEAGELGIEFLKEQEKAAADAAAAMEKHTSMADLTSEMDAAEKKWVEGWRKMRGEVEETAEQVYKVWQNAAGFWTNTNDAFSAGWSEGASEFQREWNGAWARFQREGDSAAKQVQRAIDQATKERTTTIRIRAIETRQAGGLVGLARFARGGKLPGYGGGDRIPALLESGEFVIRKEAVRKFGAGMFNALNNLRLPELPDLSVLFPQPAAALPGGGGHMVLELQLPGGDTVAATVSGDDAERLARFNRRVSNTRFRR